MYDLKINNNYKIVPIDSVIPDPENARLHDYKDIEEKKAALKEFGWTRACVVNEETSIIAVGNGFWQAAKELGYKEIPAIFISMSAVRAKALAISDNRLGDHGKYNLEQFNINISEIAEWDANINWSALGFSNSEIKLLLASVNGEVENTSGQCNEDNYDTGASHIPTEKQKSKPIHVTLEQREIFEEARIELTALLKNDRLKEGKVVEILSRAFLQNPNIIDDLEIDQREEN